ncbi:hypothetical protein K3163_02410 [Qipengyuania sp. 1NDW9]|uniref:hypothetical protein n=1 Tax=Qipengyuania xiapuensis TaxID=2867236 RepID=UPI001C878806|nr:hypothetical protein [Qipengyuania xiapuensis]MBX7492058.1 hypothetical protein [Qipengyuania xiapuensis]
MRFTIPSETPSPEFISMWRAAGVHLQSFFEGGLQSWLKANPHPPFLEHLSFILGNQVYFVRTEDVDDNVEVPGTRAGLRKIAEGWNGHACLMPMLQTENGWRPVQEDWGLIDLRTNHPIDPLTLATHEKIEVTDWELADFAVKVVRDWLVAEGRSIMSSQSDPDVEPSIWFVGDEGPEWVIVRAARYPEKVAEIPDNWTSVARECAHLSHLGNFANVAFDCADNPGTPIIRGEAAEAEFGGLQPLRWEG